MNPSEDFLFFKQENKRPPQKASEHIFQFVQDQLQPTFFKVITKILLIHLLVGSLVILVCPQLGVGPFGEHFGLTAVFMTWGEMVCSAICGFLFFAVSILVSLFYLRSSEIRVVKRWRVVATSILVFGSCGILMLLRYFFLETAIEFISIMTWNISAVISVMFWIQLVSYFRINKDYHVF